jgi:hypothetical protein
MEGYIDNILLESNVNGFRDQPASSKLFEWNDNEPILPLSDHKRIHRVALSSSSCPPEQGLTLLWL